jgi:hypothetical protein
MTSAGVISSFHPPEDGGSGLCKPELFKKLTRGKVEKMFEELRMTIDDKKHR